ncbi:MFS general substrate transporter [Rhizodiscina lignyota]|uniref:MFS general substrate transporter n=1 Tax=Rhizodiscina lignyota TaxID=1504668 RepID=A0A9P4M8L5_9PEZI|nr:MFS general substrate transporter [Rhizodiscina lignyota]
MASDKKDDVPTVADARSPSIDDVIGEKAPVVAADARELYELYHRSDERDVDTAEAKRVLRKVDWRILPMLFMTYFLQFLDKSGINYASVYGLQKGTHLHGQDYSWLGSIFYFGYLAAQFPAGYLMQRLPMAKVTGVSILGWGIIMITTPACVSFAGIAVNRFLLGALEGVVNPAFILILSMWYSTAEQPIRLESYYCTNGIATMFGGLIGYAIGHITSGLPQWMYVFLIFGSLSIFWGIVFLLVTPDLPSTANFLSPAERIVAVKRVAGNRQGIKNAKFSKRQAYQTVVDPKTWMLVIMAVAAQIPNAALTSFTSLVIQGFGFDTLGSQYLQIPGGAVHLVSTLTGGYICSRFRNVRFITMIVASTICILGSGLLVGLPNSNKWGRMVALWLCNLQSLGFSMSLTIVSSNIGGYTKKQLTGAALFVAYCVGNIIGPQTFRANEAPGYHSAYVAMLIGYCIKLLMMVCLYVYMWRVNKSRDRDVLEGRVLTEEEEKDAIERGMQDMTEIDNRGFRYAL